MLCPMISRISCETSKLWNRSTISATKINRWKIWNYFWRWFRVERQAGGSGEWKGGENRKGRRKGQRATYTRRWITHDCLAWNYSISPPLARTTDYPPGLACSLRFHSIMHPASPTSHLLLLLPPLRSYYYFSARDLAPTTSFLAKPGVDDDDETRRAGNSIVPSLSVAKSGLTRLFLRKIRLRGETLTSLCVARGWKPHSWMKSDFSDDREFASILQSNSLRFFSSLVFDGRPFMASLGIALKSRTYDFIAKSLYFLLD